MDFADFIAPIPVARFMAAHYGRKPLHIPADEARRSIFSWDRLNALLGILPHWTEANLKLILDGTAVASEHYLIEAETASGRARRASPAKVEAFLAMGASLVADGIEDIAPEIKAATAMLSATFAGKAGANAYCSFRGLQAFPSHCDPHEVFAVHAEGEKVWRIYTNRADAPVATLEGEGAQALIDRIKGPVLMEVTMRPGDLLYIPRGFYHDALVSAEASLHLTLAVMPLTGRVLFRMLEEMAIEDPAFRAWLPDGREDLQAHLADLGQRMAAMVATPRFAMEVATRQRALADPPHGFALPKRLELEFMARTDKPAAVMADDEDWYLEAGNERVSLAGLGAPAAWMLERPAFALQQLYAEYGYLPPSDLAALAALFRDKGLLAPYRPTLR